MSPLIETHLPLPDPRRGKVRDVYQCRTRRGDDATLLIATDRISAFDVVMPTPVPGKGELLTRTAAVWFDLIGRELPDIPHHLLSTDIDDVVGLTPEQCDPLRGRVMIGRRCRVIPIECVVRGYLAGSAWTAYAATGEVCGVPLPPGVPHCGRLAEPMFTPATKAANGHDENISFRRACGLVGEGVMHRLRAWSLAVYSLAHDHALQRGLILADTKFEFGVPLVSDRATRRADADLEHLLLIDEVLTPDSSRYWPADAWHPGEEPPGFDKQFVRNHLLDLVRRGLWDKTPPGPTLPAEVVRDTRAKYQEAHRRLTAELPDDSATA